MGIFDLFGTTKARPKTSPFFEAGVSGVHISGGWLVDREKNQKLTYLQRTVKYEELMSNIAVVGSGVRYFTSLGAAAVWSVEPSEDDRDERYADFMRMVMESTGTPWSAIVKYALMYRYLGFSLQEMIAAKDDDGNAILSDIENRPVRTIEQFDIDQKDGKLYGFGQRNVNTGETLYIPKDKCLYIVDNLINDSPAGLGILRHVFESCERLQRLMNYETMAYAKDMRGIPVGRVPASELALAVKNGEVTEEQAKIAITAMENLVKMTSKLPDTGLILDSKTYTSRSDTGVAVTGNKQWDIELLQGSAPGLSDIGKAIERIQKEIARVLSSEAQMLDGAGSNALSKDKSSNAYLAVNAAINDVVDAANRQVIPFIWKLNGFDPKLAPKFKVEDVSDKDAESVAAVLKDMATAGATLSPDDEVINDIRDMLGVSRLDLEAAAAQMLEEQETQAQQMQVNV